MLILGYEQYPIDEVRKETDMKKKNGLGKAIVWGAAAAAAGVAAKKAYDNSKKKQEEKVDNVSDQVMENRSYE